jgi:hypothetical protein
MHCPLLNVGYESVKFSVEVHHGGFFVGKGVNLTYLDEKICWFDNLDRRTLRNDCIYYMLAQLNYPDHEKIMYWCPPGKTLADMVEIILEADCQKMAKASVHSKVLVLFVRHIRKADMQEEDDIVFKGCPVLPKVILSPLSKDKIMEMKSEKLSGSSNNASNRKNSEQQEDAAGTEEAENSDISENSEVSEEEYECDSDIDPTWYDSDYRMEEDDEEYDKNVDDVVHDALIEKGKSIGAEYRHVPGTDVVYEDDLQLPEEDDWERKHKSDSDDEEYKKKKKKEKPIYRFKAFNPAVDMENPQFKLGMVFDSVELLRKVVAQYAVKNRVQIRKKRNNKQRFEAVCEEGCPWKLVAVNDNRTPSFLVKTLIGEHTCEKVWDVKELTAPFLASKYVEKFRDNSNCKFTLVITKTKET